MYQGRKEPPKDSEGKPEGQDQEEVVGEDHLV